MFVRRIVAVTTARTLLANSSGRTVTRALPVVGQAAHAQFSSIKDMFTNYASNKMNESREKQFQKMVDTMATAEKWTFRSWKALLEDQLNSWMMYIPGVSGSKDVQSIKELKTILDAMTDEELDNPEKVNGAARERISKATGKPIETVRGLIYLHKNTNFYHQVLKMRKQNNEPLPSSPGEMTKIFEDDPRVRPIFEQIFRANTRPTGRGRRRYG